MTRCRTCATTFSPFPADPPTDSRAGPPVAPSDAAERRPLVSVIIPAYNVAEWISSAIDSVLAQTYEPFEVVVVDDGSTDDTAAVVEGYGGRVRCVHQANRGLAGARNAGIRAAQGDLIAFLDADDLWMPEKLEVQAEMLRQTPDAGWVYSDALVVDPTARVVLDRIGRTCVLPSGDVLRPLFLHNFIASPTPMVRRSALERVGPFDESPPIRIAEDWDMWLRLAGSFPAACVQRPLAKVRSHGKSMTGTMDLDVALSSKLAVAEKAVRLRKDLAPLRSRALAAVHADVGEWMYRRGDYSGARAAFGSALRARPLAPRALGYWLATFLPAPAILALVRLRRRTRALAIARGAPAQRVEGRP